MYIEIPNVEVRGIDKKFSAKTQSDYIVINFDDVHGVRESVIDRDLRREPLYKRGVVGTFECELKMGRSQSGSYASIEVKDFRV